MKRRGLPLNEAKTSLKNARLATSSATRADLTVTKRTANGIRAWRGSGHAAALPAILHRVGKAGVAGFGLVSFGLGGALGPPRRQEASCALGPQGRRSSAPGLTGCPDPRRPRWGAGGMGSAL